MKDTVAIVTYRRVWMPHSLASIVNQTTKPDETPQLEECFDKSYLCMKLI
jgi:hypothetical protein